MSQQPQEELQQIKDVLVNEVATRQQLSARLEQVTKNAQSLQISFSEALQTIRTMNKAGDSAAISAKIDSLIGPEPKEPEAPKAPEAPVKAK